ncbi:hypothetical protein [Salipiger mucosus]|uniref:Uncharacterized protein n=1 Tax=Salipiger mucosus DSM 16094 TaxID=1123237 RepID=S9QIZ5_9RHOB|nr:hypothetical protein [Salipiger mucosus]EPX79782.1 hypothetical protein Salmuc_05140 [Salipiger mucosus DSM 16094]
MTIDLADIARGRRIVALAVRDLGRVAPHARPVRGPVSRLLRSFGLFA